MTKKIKSETAPSIKFEIEGAGEFTSSMIPKCVGDMIGAFEKLENGKLLRAAAVASRISRSLATIQNHMGNPALNDFKFMHRKIAYFGNKQTIKAARTQFSM